MRPDLTKNLPLSGVYLLLGGVYLLLGGSFSCHGFVGYSAILSINGYQSVPKWNIHLSKTQQILGSIVPSPMVTKKVTGGIPEKTGTYPLILYIVIVK